MKKSWILGIVFLLLFVSSVSAVPSPKTEILSGDLSYNIMYPPFFFYKDKQNLSFEFHVTNSSGKPIISGIACYFHLYNNLGEHIYLDKDYAVSEDLDYSFKLNYTNLTSGASEYYYYVNCNDSANGGAVTSNFFITTSGREIDEGRSLIYCILIIVIIVLMVSCLITAFTMDTSRDYEIIDGVLKFNFKRYLKVLLYFMFYNLLTMLVYMSWQISYEFLTAPFMTDVLRIVFIMLEIGLIPIWVITFLVMLIKWLGDVKARLEIERGVPSR